MIKDLKTQGYAFNQAIISYFDSIKDLYVHVGKEPFKENVGIPLECIVGNQVLIDI